MTAEICGDNRFEIIDKAKKHLLEATNIDTSTEEMAVLDSFLFRCWQMGWLDKYDASEQVTSKLESAEIPTVADEESTTSQPKSKLDLISRADVHKTLSLLATEGGADAKMLLMDAHEFIDALPSAGRPHGEWIIDTYNMELKCGICGEIFRFDDVDELLDYKEYAKYCLACGSQMGGAE